MNLNVHGLMIWVRALAENANLTVQFYPADGKKRAPATDSKTIYVDHPLLEWDNEKVMQWQAGIYHEIGHNVPAMRDIFTRLEQEKIDTREFYGSLLNLVDDYRQEHYKYDEFLNKQRVMNHTQGVITKGIAESVGKQVLKNPNLFKDNPNAGKILAMLIGDTNARKSWQSHATTSVQYLEDIAPPEVTQYSDILKQPEWVEKYENMTTADDVFNLVDDILKNVFKMNPEKEKKKAQRQGQGEGDAQKAGEGKQDIGTAQEELEKSGKPTEKQLINAMNKDKHLTKVEKCELGNGTGRSGLYSGTGTFVPLDQKEIHVIGGKDIDYNYGSGRNIRWMPTSSLAKSVRRVLLSEKQTKREHGQKRGKVDPKNVHRVTMRDAKGVNERIFRRKTNRLDVDVAVCILQDCSGSMSGGKYELASNATINLGEALNHIGVPYQVAGFTDGQEVRIWKFKGFEDKFNKSKMQHRFEVVYGNMGNNDDPDCVLWAYNQLMTRKESRKILIVLSDGSPASSSNPTSVYEGLRTVNESIHKSSPVELYGIGIMYDNVKKYYPECEVINNIQTLEPALLKLIHRKIIKPK